MMNDIREYAKLVKEVRSLQKEFFKTRAGAVLAQSKMKEKELDRITESIILGSEQKSIF